MIIGPTYVFIAVPRTASLSIAAWLIAHHEGAWVGEHHGTEIPAAHQGKYTFTVVRDPYTRLPSLWRYLRDVFWPKANWRNSAEAAAWRELGMPLDSALVEFVNWAASQIGRQWCSQAAMLRDVRLHAILRFEELRQHLAGLPFVSGLSDVARVPHLNQTTSEALTEAEVLAIMKHSAEDFARFAYDRVRSFRPIRAGVAA